MRCRLLVILFCLVAQGLVAQDDLSRSIDAYKELNYDSAFIYVDKAIAQYQSRGLIDSLAFAQIHRADMIWAVKGLAPGLAAIEQAVQAASRLPNFSLARVAALDKKAQIFVHNQESAKARKLFEQALAQIDKKASPNNYYASVYKNFSWLLLVEQDFGRAMEYALEAKRITESLYGQDSRQLLGVYQSLMFIAHDAGDYSRAEEYGLELIRLAEKHLSPDHPNRGLAHNDMGILYETMHRYDEALYHKQEMVRITQLDYARTKNPQLLAIAYNNMGSFYQGIGEYQLSLDYYDKARRLHEVNFGAESVGIVRPLTHLANMKMMTGSHAEADSLYNLAYSLQQKLDGKDWQNLAYVETQYGDLFYQKNDYKQAAAYYQRALENNRKAGILNNGIVQATRSTLGESYAQMGHLAEALELFKGVLVQYRSSYPAGHIVIAGQLHKIAGAYLVNKEYEQALQFSDSCFIELLQLKTRAESGDGQRWKPGQGWIEQLPYNHFIIQYLQTRSAILEALYKKTGDQYLLEELLQLAGGYGGFLSKSLPAMRTQTSVMQLSARHREIYNSAIEACWELYQKTKQPAYLHRAFEYAERSKGLLLRLSANNMLADLARAENNTNSDRDLYWRKLIGSLNARYLDAETKNDSLLIQLTAAIEGYRKFQDSLIAQGDPSAKIKYDLEPASILSIQQFLKKQDQTLLQYVVTDEYVFIFMLSEKRLQVHRLGRKVEKDIAALRELYNLDADSFRDPAYRLYKQLIQPVEKNISGKNLLVIPDGELFYLNLELLIRDSSAKHFSDMAFLLNKYNISYQLSATNAMLVKSVKRKADQKALLMAPVFTDEMKAAYQQELADSSAADPYYLRLLRQPFTLMAVHQIGQHVQHDLFAEQQARESVIKNVNGNYSILHLGTHAEVNNTAPLMSRFFMAKPLRSDSTEADDGYLHAYEIYGLPLNADLAVLTACETGTGNWVGGEGVISLAHSFMYAGCPSVVMSLWKIDEKASADIITEFYKNLSRGLPKGEALRRAKRAHIGSDDALAHPYFWAGMTLMGDNDPLYRSGYRYWIIGALVAVALAAAWRFKKSSRSYTSDRC